MSTLILPAPTGDLPDEAIALDVDALRKAVIDELRDLSDEHKLLWPMEVQVFDHGTHASLTLRLDDDRPEAQAAWSAALALVATPDRGLLSGEPFVARLSNGRDVMGCRTVEVWTALYLARGLPEQGPRPEPADPTLPETWCTLPFAEATRDALANALLAVELHHHATAVLVDGAEADTWWVEIRTIDEAELCRLFVPTGVWWIGGEVTDRLSSSDGPQAFAEFVDERLAEVSAAGERDGNIPDRALGCDAPPPAPLYMQSDGSYTCRCTVCGRCDHHTGNSNQGHYWRLCKVTGQSEEFHYCCPGDCELQADEQRAEVAR